MELNDPGFESQQNEIGYGTQTPSYSMKTGVLPQG